MNYKSGRRTKGCMDTVSVADKRRAQVLIKIYHFSWPDKRPFALSSSHREYTCAQKRPESVKYFILYDFLFQAVEK